MVEVDRQGTVAQVRVDNGTSAPRVATWYELLLNVGIQWR